MTQTCNNCAEIHFGGGVMSPISPLCPPFTLVVELWALSLPFVHHRPSTWSNCHLQCSLRKDSRKFCPYYSDCCCALMLMCQNSPLWQHC